MAKQPGKTAQASSVQDLGLSVAVSSPTGNVTARKAGTITDLELCISPKKVPVARALQNLAKSVNLALKSDFIETELDKVYKGARVYRGTVQVLHEDYIGLGDGVFAKLGKTAKSFQLTLRGPDAGSPDGKEWIAEHGGGAIGGLFNLMARKLDLLQEFEDQVAVYTEQMLDRLEGAKIITDWHREEWDITTTFVGMDIILTPHSAEEAPASG